MTVEIKVNDKVRTVTDGELKLLRELGVAFEDTADQTEAFAIVYKQRFNRYSYYAKTEKEVNRLAAEHEKLAPFHIVKINKLRFIKYKYGRDWNFKFSYVEEVPSGYHLMSNVFYKTREEAEQYLEARKTAHELRKQHEEKEQELYRQYLKLQEENRKEQEELRKKLEPKSLNLLTEVPHFRSDRPDAPYGERYERWREKTGGKETLTPTGRYD